MKAFGLMDEQATAAVMEIPAPEPGSGEVRVRVRNSSVNGFDVSVAKGLLRGMMEHRYPVVGGKDFAGVVESVGEAVTDLAPGDEVAGVTPYEPVLSRGAFAELVVVPASGFIQRRPPDLDLERAASVGLAAITALASVDAVEASDGDVVLVVGAAGGVGAYAVQLAARRGATVVATALPEDADWLRGLGAGEVVDYSGDVVAAVRAAHPKGVDALIVAVNLGDAFEPTATLVKDGGRLASTLGGAEDESLAARRIVGTNVIGQSDPERLPTVLRMADEGALAVPITRRYAFDELPEALGLVGERRSRGKFAVTISS